MKIHKWGATAVALCLVLSMKFDSTAATNNTLVHQNRTPGNGSYTVSEDGLYKIAIFGGDGGALHYEAWTDHLAGSSGGGWYWVSLATAGGEVIVYADLSAGDTISYYVGAAGRDGSWRHDPTYNYGPGQASSVSINGTLYATAYAGAAGTAQGGGSGSVTSACVDIEDDNGTVYKPSIIKYKEAFYQVPGNGAIKITYMKEMNKHNLFFNGSKPAKIYLNDQKISGLYFNGEDKNNLYLGH